MIRKKNSPRRYPFIGKIKVGEKIKTKNGERPVSLDYFRATGNFSHIFHSLCGEKPKTIEIGIPSVDCLDVRYELRKGKKIVAISDGDNVITYNSATGEKETQEKSFSELKEVYEKKAGNPWVEILRLDFYIPQTKMVGLWRIETKGVKSSMENIENYIYNIVEMGLPIEKITFMLSVEKVTSQILQKANFPVISLVGNLNINKNFKKEIKNENQIESNSGIPSIQEDSAGSS